MTIALIFVSGLAAALGAAAVWSLVVRSRERVESAELRAHSAEADRRALEAHARADALERELRERTLEAGRVREEAARLRQEVEGLGAQLQRDAHAMRDLHEREIANVETAYRERHESVTREKQAIEKKLAEMGEQMRAAFGSLAASALKESTSEFLKLAGERFAARDHAANAELDKKREAVERLVAPIAETLKRTDAKLDEIERTRAATGARLLEQVDQMARAGNELRLETGRLVRALREPQVRGRYGEIQLKRVAELAGMRSYCDFAEQSSTVDSEGNMKRPDMVVKLPNGRELVVDAKANLKPYLDALESPNAEQADECLQRFADGLVKQAGLLGRKGYYKEYAGSPDFVVMFVPGDQFVDAALAKRPELLDMAAQERVLLASPSTLIAMLRAVAVGFAEQKLTDEARAIRSLALELHERAATMLEHLGDLGRGIESVVARYNKLAGSVEARLMPTLKKLEEKEVKSDKQLEDVKEVVVKTRLIEDKVANEP